MTIPSSDDLQKLCTDMGLVDAAGQLKRLDPAQKMMVLVEAKRVLGAMYSVEQSRREMFTSFDELSRYFADSESAPEPVSTTLEERTARARGLVDSYRGKPGVIGAYFCGSAAMPVSIPLADIDVFVVLEDAAFDELKPAERQIRTLSELPSSKDVDLSFVPWSHQIAVSQSTQDGLRAAFRSSKVLFAVDDRLPMILTEMATLPKSEVLPRLQVYFLEYIKHAFKSMKAMLKPDLATAKVLQFAALDAMRSLLFVAYHRFPTRRHCAVELRDAGVREPVIRAWESAMLSEMPRFDLLLGMIKEVLVERGETFHLDFKTLMDWLHYAPEARVAFDRWATAS